MVLPIGAGPTPAHLVSEVVQAGTMGWEEMQGNNSAWRKILRNILHAAQSQSLRIQPDREWTKLYSTSGKKQSVLGTNQRGIQQDKGTRRSKKVKRPMYAPLAPDQRGLAKIQWPPQLL